MIKRIQLTALLSLTFICSCSEESNSPIEIKGQVFVIQQNRVNIKLGGVSINYVPKKTLESRVQWISKSQEDFDQIRRHTKQLHAIDERIADAAEESGAAEIKTFLDSSRRLQELAWSEFRSDATVIELSAINSCYEQPLFSVVDASSSRWKLASLFADWLESASSAKATTDADGNFSISIPANGSGYLFAQASRIVSPDNAENYFWIFEVDGRQAGPVHLTSNNVVNSSILSGLQSSSFKSPGPKECVSDLRLRSLEWFDQADVMLGEIANNRRRIEMLRQRSTALKDELNYLKARPKS